MKKAALFVTMVALTALGTSPAMAAIDVAPVVTEIGTYPALIASVGAGVLIVGLAVKGIRWVAAAFGR